MSRLTAAVLAAMAFGGIHEAGFIPAAPPNSHRRRGPRKGRMTRFEWEMAYGAHVVKDVIETPRFARTKKGKVRSAWRDQFTRRYWLRVKKRARNHQEVVL